MVSDEDSSCRTSEPVASVDGVPVDPLPAAELDPDASEQDYYGPGIT